MKQDPPRERPAFRRWHERRLLESFAWLTLCLLSGVLFATVLEFIGLSGEGLRPLLALILLYLAGLLGVSAWRRFWGIFSHAQRCANAATCPQCGAYGLFEVGDASELFPAVCRRCGHRWTIDPRAPDDKR